jgi:hypothetical protein
MKEYSSSDEEEEEEEEVREQVLLDRWEPAPQSPEPALVAEVSSPGAGAEAPATRQSTAEAARAAEVPARAAEASVHMVEAPVREAEPARVAKVVGSVAAAAPTTSAGTSRKRKHAFSSLR